MRTITFKCKNCGGKVTFNEEIEGAICPKCGKISFLDAQADGEGYARLEKDLEANSIYKYIALIVAKEDYDEMVEEYGSFKYEVVKKTEKNSSYYRVILKRLKKYEGSVKVDKLEKEYNKIKADVVERSHNMNIRGIYNLLFEIVLLPPFILMVYELFEGIELYHELEYELHSFVVVIATILFINLIVGLVRVFSSKQRNKILIKANNEDMDKFDKVLDDVTKISK